VEPALQQELFCELLFDKAKLLPSVPLKSFLFTQLLTTYATASTLIAKIETMLARVRLFIFRFIFIYSFIYTFIFIDSFFLSGYA
jgi:hypothetical protein